MKQTKTKDAQIIFIALCNECNRKKALNSKKETAFKEESHGFEFKMYSTFYLIGKYFFKTLRNFEAKSFS